MTQWTSIFLAAFSVITAGLLTAAFWGERREVPEKAVFTVATAGFLVAVAAAAAGLLQLGRPTQVFHTLAHPSSPFFWTTAGLTLSLIFSASYGAALWKGSDSRSTLFLASCAAAAGWIAAVGSAAALYMPWRPALNTWTVFLPFTGVAAQAALVALPALFEKASAKKLFTTGAATSLAGLVVYVIALFITPEARDYLLSAFSSPALWLAAVTLWGIAPLVANLPGKTPIKSTISLASVFTGAVFLRILIGTLGEADWHFFVR